ncbi:alpha/beta hydrolase [Sulfurimonas sp. HSL-1656]|uniref:alpha/beta hydrolase n=1 Tax=Thiomicrolovo subterrani TaxID=3131934 RepID=UPI0031F92D3E
MKLAAYAVAIAVLLVLSGCEAMVFQPDSRVYATPTDLNLSYREVRFDSRDGTRLSGWWLEPGGVPRGTVMVVHGNAQNISAHFLGFDWLVRAGYEVFIFDYRGYGASEGSPGLEGAVEDTEAALAYVLARRGGRVTVIGQSLGGALLFNALARQGTERIALAVFDSTFASLPQAGREALDRSVVGWPVQWGASLALTDRFDPIGIAPSLAVPKLYIAGSKDSIISPNHSWQLFDASTRPRAFWLVTEAGHIATFNAPLVRARFLAFIRRPVFDPDASAMLIFDRSEPAR